MVPDLDMALDKDIYFADLVHAHISLSWIRD